MYNKNILQTIFSDHFEYIQYLLRPVKNVMYNINRMIHCHDPSYGGAFFGCPHCGNLKFVPFSCKCRFCPSCGNMYTRNELFVCPVSSFPATTGTVSLQFLRSSVSFSLRIIPSLTASSILSEI